MEMPPSDQSPPHLPAGSPPVAGGIRSLPQAHRDFQPVFAGATLFAGRIGTKITKVGTYQTVSGFREAVQLYMAQGWYVGTTKQAVAGMIAQAVRRSRI